MKQFPDLEYSGFDFDKVEHRNIGPQAYFLEHIGQPKAVAMVGVLKRFLRTPKYKAYVQKIEKLNPIEFPKTLVLDCFDNTQSRKLLAQLPGDVFHVGFSPLYAAEGIWSPEYDAPNDIASGAPDICTLPDATGFIHFTVNAAVLAVTEFLLEGRKRSFIVTKSQGRIPTLRTL